MKHFCLGAACAAVIGLAACTSHSQATDATARQRNTGVAIAPVSCSEQYRTWNRESGKGLMDALAAIDTAVTAKHTRVLTKALRRVKPALTRGARDPIPECADPRGYWNVLLMHVNAAVAEKASASTIRTAVQDVPKIHHQLLAEVKQAVR